MFNFFFSNCCVYIKKSEPTATVRVVTSPSQQHEVDTAAQKPVHHTCRLNTIARFRIFSVQLQACDFSTVSDWAANRPNHGARKGSPGNTIVSSSPRVGICHVDSGPHKVGAVSYSNRMCLAAGMLLIFRKGWCLPVTLPPCCVLASTEMRETAHPAAAQPLVHNGCSASDSCNTILTTLATGLG